MKLIKGGKEENQIINGDCYEELAKQEDGKFKLAIIDPPYLLSGGQGGGAYGRDKQKYYKDLDYIGEGFDFNILNILHEKLEKINLYIFCNKALLLDLIVHYRTKHPELTLDILVWNKTNPVPACNQKYLADLEYVLFIREKGVRVNGSYQTKSKLYQSPLNVKDKKKFNHPTCKPVEFLTNLIINSSNEGDFVLDCFAGSGSLAEACLKTNRKFVVIEKEKSHFETIKKRVQETQKELKEVA